MTEATTLLWQFVRGDLRTEDFARQCYGCTALESFLGAERYLELISTDFRDVVAVQSLRAGLDTTLRALPNHTCSCITIADGGVVDMGEHEDVFRSIETVKERGQPFWWLWASRCRECGQAWLIGSEERHNDVYCMKRLSPGVLADIQTKGVWPPDFDRYETLLQIGRAAGRSVRFVDPLESGSLDATISDLARERPGIRLTEIASLLSLDQEIAKQLAARVVAKHKLSIALDE